jgi:rare lipoprotein A (peptidoglycan hydrolase)
MRKLVLTIAISILSMSSSAFADIVADGSPTDAYENSDSRATAPNDLILIEELPEEQSGLSAEQEAYLEQYGFVPVPAEQYAANGRIQRQGGKLHAARVFSGVASYYSVRSNNHNTRTASGTPLRDSSLTAAHKTLPFGTKVKVTHGSRSVVVTITDRGPFVRGRVLDLSVAAAHAVGIAGSGTGRVVAEIL